MSRSHWRISFFLAILMIPQTAVAVLPGDGSSTQPAVDTPVTTSPDTTTAEEDNGEETSSSITPRVEIFVPSVEALVQAGRESRSAALYEALAGMIPMPDQETDEGLDIAAVVRLVEKIGTWADTSVALAIFTVDRDGRSRWALRADWPLKDLVGYVEDLLNDQAAAQLLDDVTLRRDEEPSPQPSPREGEGEDGAEDGPVRYRLEMPEVLLAVLSESGSGCLIASAADLQPPESIFGQPPADAIRQQENPRRSALEKGGSRKKRSLIYCRLNLGAGDEGGQGSLFSKLSGIHEILYAASLKKGGLWNERFGISWNPLLGMALKAMFRKTRRPFECPRDAYAVAVMNLGLGEGLADALAGLSPGTIGGRAGSEMAVAVVPGTGFLPFPDVFYEFRARRKAAIIKDIRRFIIEANKKRREDDRPPQWHETNIDERTVFWHNPSNDGGFGLSLLSYRTVIFFVDPAEGGSKGSRLIIARTSTWAEDAVRRWDALSQKTYEMPSSDKVHWQARIRWRKIYELAEPYLALLAGFAKDATIPPDAEDLEGALADAVVDVRIGYGGLRVRHRGPIPLGAVYVPVVAAVSLRSVADPSSESARQRAAARHLRVLYHHAKLFKKDYGRWPATVAELDGYVDFASHTELLKLQPKEKSFMEGLTSMLTRGKPTFRGGDEASDDEEDIDDSLYVIAWSADDGEWRLGIREGEFRAYKTMYIDAAGDIHRVRGKDGEEAVNGGEDRRGATEVKKRSSLGRG